MPRPRLDAEHHWFNQWRSTVEGVAQIYEQILYELYLRAADLELVIEIAISRHVTRDALRNHSEEWRRAADLLNGRAPLVDIIGRLFGEEVPASVALMALEAVSQEDEGSDTPDAAIGHEVRKREEERRSLGSPTYLWVVEYRERGTMLVSVRRRDEVAKGFLGLIRVVDVRQPS